MEAQIKKEREKSTGVIVYSCILRSLRAYCSRSELAILKLRESTAGSLHFFCTIEGFHVMSYQANFASHITRDRHVGFLTVRLWLTSFQDLKFQLECVCVLMFLFLGWHFLVFFNTAPCKEETNTAVASMMTCKIDLIWRRIKTLSRGASWHVRERHVGNIHLLQGLLHFVGYILRLKGVLHPRPFFLSVYAFFLKTTTHW